jgi:hypothetical protein
MRRTCHHRRGRAVAADRGNRSGGSLAGELRGDRAPRSGYERAVCGNLRLEARIAALPCERLNSIGIDPCEGLSSIGGDTGSDFGTIGSLVASQERGIRRRARV